MLFTTRCWQLLGVFSRCFFHIILIKPKTPFCTNDSGQQLFNRTCTWHRCHCSSNWAFNPFWQWFHLNFIMSFYLFHVAHHGYITRCHQEWFTSTNRLRKTVATLQIILSLISCSEVQRTWKKQLLKQKWHLWLISLCHWLKPMNNSKFWFCKLCKVLEMHRFKVQPSWVAAYSQLKLLSL